MAKFAIFQVSVNFFILVTGLGLDQALMREFNEANSPRKLLISILKVLGVTASFGVIVLGIIKIYAHEVLSGSITISMALACVLMLLNRVYNSFIRMSGDGLAFAIDAVAPKLIQLILVLIVGGGFLAVLSYDLVVKIIVATSMISLLYEVVVANKIGRKLDGNNVGTNIKIQPQYTDLLKFGAPLVPGAVAFYAISASSVYVIGLKGTPVDVVIVSLAISVGGGLAVLGTVFSTLWTPFAYRWHAKAQSPALYGFIATLVVMGCAVVLLMILFVSPYLSIIFPDKYGSLTSLVVVVAVWNLLYIVSVVGSFGIGVKRMSTASMLISIAGAVISIGISTVVSQYFGAHGVLLVVLAAFFITLVLNCEISTRGWHRVLALDHYLMVGAMCISGVLFSFGFEWQAKLFLVLAIVFYIPSSYYGLSKVYTIFKATKP